MATSQLSRTVKGVLKQRELLIQKGKSHKNTLLCCKIIKDLKYQIEAYQNKWDDGGWKRFVQRNYTEIIYLIPDSPSGSTIKRKIYEAL